ncbi:unnamed protein product [Effrenium voratum]|nr:unnamed protein product [Effrenium voratum]
MAMPPQLAFAASPTCNGWGPGAAPHHRSGYINQASIFCSWTSWKCQLTSFRKYEDAYGWMVSARAHKRTSHRPGRWNSSEGACSACETSFARLWATGAAGAAGAACALRRGRHRVQVRCGALDVVPPEAVEFINNNVFEMEHPYPTFGLVDSVDSPALYQAVLKFIGDKGVGSSWEFQAGPGAPERLRCLPGLGVHSVHRLGDMDAVATVHLEKGPRRQIVAFLPFEKRLEAKSLLSQFFEMCLAHSNVKAVSDTVREEAEAQGGKWWVQELVEQAIREQEAEEGKEDTAIDADPDRWSELKPDEAEKRGARRLGLDFDPLGPA